MIIKISYPGVGIDHQISFIEFHNKKSSEKNLCPQVGIEPQTSWLDLK
jgi:hypothetical protein